MNIKTTAIHLFILFLFSSLHAYSQQYIYPLNIKLQLSSNFGELRNNHFHSGIDLKTDGVVNKPVFAIDNGYVSRINVSAGGYGLALYIDHPTGQTSVYGHLNSFSPKIAAYATQKQYENENFDIDVYLKPGEIPVKKGEQVALSGNTGSSGGPHVHFEIRDTKTQDPIDALDFYANTIPDNQKPDIRGIAFYPVTGKGVVNGTNNPIRLTISKNKAGVPLALNSTISAWGRIGLGVKAYDKMNGQGNIYGVKFVRLYKDEELVFSSAMDRFPFAKTRMLNTFTDFEDWRDRRSFYMKSFIDPGNTLPVYETKNNGYIDINEEREYRMRYELEDQRGNTLTYSFIIQGKPQPVPQKDTCTNYMAWNMHNSFVDYDFLMDIPAGNLYSDFCFSHKRNSSPAFYSDIHQVNNAPVALDKRGTIWIKLKADSLENRANYGIVEIGSRGSDWIGGAYKNGGLEVAIRELGGRYAIDIDTIAPKITAQTPEKWVSDKRIRVRVTDDKSGIRSFRGEIDGRYVLFTNDVKSSYYIYDFDDRIARGQNHELVFTATDGAGNSTEYRYSFTL